MPVFDMVKMDIKSQAMHVATLSETWLKEEHPTTMVDIPGYQLIRQDRTGVKSTKGGGLAPHINENFVTDTTSWAHLNQISDVAEMLWIEIKTVKFCWESFIDHLVQTAYSFWKTSKKN